MLDTNLTPLLSQPNSADDSEPPKSRRPPPENHLPCLGSIIEHCLSEFNSSQFLQAVLISFAWAFDAQQTFITVFTDVQPSPSTPTHHDGPHSSIISEWALKPEAQMIAGLPASSFFMGCLVGGLALSTLADSSLGRKNMLIFFFSVNVIILLLYYLFLQPLDLFFSQVPLQFQPPHDCHVRPRPRHWVRWKGATRSRGCGRILLLHSRLPLPPSHGLLKSKLLMEEPLYIHLHPQLFLLCASQVPRTRVSKVALHTRKERGSREFTKKHHFNIWKYVEFSHI